MGNQIVIPSMGNWYIEPLRKAGIGVKSVIESGTFFITLDCYSLKDPREQLIVKAYESNELLEENNLAQSCKVYFKTLLDLSKNASIFGLSCSQIYLQNNLVFFFRKKHQFTLSQRLEEYPPLENVEKRWISYRLLTLVSMLHQITNSLIHGAINPDNVFVTWDLDVSIGDMAPFKPTYIKYNRPDLFHHFFTTASRGACYLAPEQLITSESETDNVIFMFGSFSMDFFSAGLVIYYLYTGEHLLSFSKLAEIALEIRKIKNENGANSSDAISDGYSAIFDKHFGEKIKILPDDIRDLVKALLDLDPSRRLSEQSLVNSTGKSDNNVNSYDDIISPLFPSIFKQTSDQFNEFFRKDMKLEHMIKLIPTFQMLIDDSDERQGKENWEGTFSFGKILLPKKLKAIRGLDSKLIFVNVLTNAVNSSKKVQDKSFFMNFICDYILPLSEKVKLSRILPIFVDIFSIPSDFLKSNALFCILRLVASLNIIPEGYECIFSGYLLKQIKNSCNCSAEQYSSFLASICPKLAVEIERLDPESSVMAVELLNFIFKENSQLVITSFIQSMRDIAVSPLRRKESETISSESNDNSKSDTTTSESNSNSKGDTTTSENNGNSKSDTTTSENNDNSKSDTTTSENNDNSKSDTKTSESNDNSKSDTTTSENNGNVDDDSKEKTVIPKSNEENEVNNNLDNEVTAEKDFSEDKPTIQNKLEKLQNCSYEFMGTYHPIKCHFDLFVKFSHILLSCLNSNNTYFKLSVLDVLRDFFDYSSLDERPQYRKQYSNMAPLILGYFSNEVKVSLKDIKKSMSVSDVDYSQVTDFGYTIFHHTNDEMIEGYLEFFYWLVQRKLLDEMNMPELFLNISDFRRSHNVSIRFFASKIASSLPPAIDVMNDTMFIMDIIYQRKGRPFHSNRRKSSFNVKIDVISDIQENSPKTNFQDLILPKRKATIETNPLVIKAGLKVSPEFIKSNRISNNPISIISPHFNSKLKAVISDSEGSLFYVKSTENPRDPNNLSIEPVSDKYFKSAKMSVITELQRTNLTLLVEEATGKVKVIDWIKDAIYDQFSYTFKSKPIRIVSKFSNVSFVLTESNELSVYDCRAKSLSQTIQFDSKNLSASYLCGWPQNCTILAAGFNEGLVQIIDTRMMLPISSIMTEPVKFISPCFRNYCNFVVASDDKVEVFDAFLGYSELSMQISNTNLSLFDGNTILTNNSGVFYLDCENFENTSVLYDHGIVENIGIGKKEEIFVESDFRGRPSLHKHAAMISAVDHTKELFISGDNCGMLNFWSLSPL